jgi:hypothetical protein
MTLDEERSTWTWVHRASAVVCVLLVFVTGMVAAVHAHPGLSGKADRSCSVCALAHSGVAPAQVTSSSFVFATTMLTPMLGDSAHALFLDSSTYIRPPPAV